MLGITEWIKEMLHSGNVGDAFYLATAIWWIGILLDLLNGVIKDNYGAIPHILRQFLRGLAVCIMGICIETYVICMIFKSKEATDIGIIIAFIIALRAPGFVEGAVAYKAIKK